MITTFEHPTMYLSGDGGSGGSSSGTTKTGLGRKKNPRKTTLNDPEPTDGGNPSKESNAVLGPKKLPQV